MGFGFTDLTPFDSYIIAFFPQNHGLTMAIGSPTLSYVYI